MDLMDRRGFLRNVVGGAAIVTITANAGVTLLSNVAEAAPVPADKNLQKAMEDFAETVPLDLIPISLYSYPIPPIRGRSHETSFERGGRRRLRAGFVTPLPGGLGTPTDTRIRAQGACWMAQIFAQAAIRARKRGPGASADKRNAPHENAAVKRRKARRLASSAGGPSQIKARGTGPTARRANGCGDPHQRLPALHSLGLGS